MRRSLCLRWLAAAIFLLAAWGRATASPIDLTTWAQEGRASNGDWQVATDGSWALQTVNADTTFFVSPEDYLDTRFRGTLTVETTSDDDFIGFVLGYRSPLAAAGDADNDYDFILLDWKQATQTLSSGHTAPEGFTLSRVNGPVAASTFSSTYWSHTHPAISVLDTRHGAGTGWADTTAYQVDLAYRTDRLRMDIAGGAFGSGTTVFDLPGSFPSGRFGFYTFSQRQVRYQDFEQESLSPPAVPEPGTWVLFGLGALAWIAYRRRRGG